MENPSDFLDRLDPDMSTKVLSCLEDPADLVRVSCVSHSWGHHVIADGLSKKLCLRMFPQLSRVDHVDESSCNVKETAKIGSTTEWQRREHRVYAFLARGCTSFPIRELTLEAIWASSTDNYLWEGIHNTLEPEDINAGGVSYWSSEGQSNPAVPERLTYKLVDLCVITEINIQPFQAYFQRGLPIYSAKAVRFRMGHAKSPIDDRMGELSNDSVDDKFEWTYTSQEFPMAQENCLQIFKLPEPAICLGGILQIELLGRVQTQEADGLFYICVSHVQIVGRSLSPAFGIDILEPSGKFALKALSYTQPSVLEDPFSIYGLRDVVYHDWAEVDDESDVEFEFFPNI